jgi:phosphotransferase system HPr (HPr) family protein
MITREAYVKSRYGIHARPSAKIATALKNFPDVVVRILNPVTGNKYDARSVLEIMMAAFECGDKVIIIAEGEKESQIAEIVAEIIETYEVESR